MSDFPVGLKLPRCRKCGRSLSYSGMKLCWFCSVCKLDFGVHFG
jgi:hypothetical protein